MQEQDTKYGESFLFASIEQRPFLNAIKNVHNAFYRYSTHSYFTFYYENDSYIRIYRNFSRKEEEKVAIFQQESVERYISSLSKGKNVFLISEKRFILFII